MWRISGGIDGGLESVSAEMVLMMAIRLLRLTTVETVVLLSKKMWTELDQEFRYENLPVLYNVNIGHAVPIGVLSLGIEYEIDLDRKTIRFAESAVCE